MCTTDRGRHHVADRVGGALVSRPLLLDLFCCEGGAAMGYHRAGFDVIGVDKEPQPRYPFPMVVADALNPPFDLAQFDLIHASPPCQAYSYATPDPSLHPRLIAPTRDMLMATGTPWVMENVPGAPLNAAIMLCGSMFGLGASGLSVKRHRYFEVGGWVPPALGPVCSHTPGRTITITGSGTPSGNRITLGRNTTIAEWRTAMGMPWASRRGLAEAIPPAYTEWIGHHAIAAMGAVTA